MQFFWFLFSLHSQASIFCKHFPNDLIIFIEKFLMENSIFYAMLLSQIMPSKGGVQSSWKMLASGGHRISSGGNFDNMICEQSLNKGAHTFFYTLLWYATLSIFMH